MRRAAILSLLVAGCGSTSPSVGMAGIYACHTASTGPTDCPSGEGCCAAADRSACVTVAPAVDGDYCGPASLMPSCRSAGDCMISIGFNPTYCCPTSGGIGYCTFTPSPGCVSRTFCARDADCAGPEAQRCIDGHCVIAGGDLGLPADLAAPDLAPTDLAAPDLAADLAAAPDLAGADGGTFQCHQPSSVPVGALSNADCGSGAYCCGNRTSSVCVTNSCPGCFPGNYCDTNDAVYQTLPDPPMPTCRGGADCNIGLSFHPPYCCPSLGGPDYCTAKTPFTGCAFIANGGVCSDSVCSADPLAMGRPAKCVGTQCVIQ